MPEFQYFATFDESISILADLCAQGFRVVTQPELFDEPKAPTFDHVNGELVEILKGAPAFYLAGSFTRFPVPFRQLKSGPSAGKFMIDMVTQGPLLQCMLARINEVDGVRRLLPGDVSYQDAYRNPETNKTEKASREVVAAFRQVASTIEKKCVRYNKAGVEIVIGPAALELLERGEVQVKDSHINRPPP